MTSLIWKLNRLRLMGVGEIAWRVGQGLQKKACSLGVGLVPNPPQPALGRFGARFVHETGVDGTGTLAAAEAILAGRWNVFSLRGASLGFPPVWNRDPRTGTLAPLGLGKAIDYRSEQVVGDIKYLWEPSRHLELVTLALAWKLSGEPRYAEGARQLLQSWFEQCPYPQGVHWTSSLELAVRLVNWSFAWQLLGGESSGLFEGEAGEAFRRQWLDAIYQHCHFIRGYFSRHSSANNHLFGEYMGLFIASLTWPCWPESADWQALAFRGLEAEAQKQNAPDGVNREQAVYYQHEVMDMMLLCHVVARANGMAFSAPFLGCLEKLAEFIAAVMDVAGRLPMIGDADDAQMVRLSYETDWCPYRSLLASCAILFQRGDFKAKARQFDDKNHWLMGAEGRACWDSLGLEGENKLPRAFPEGGYWILGHDFGTEDELRLVVDAAPLGYLSIAAHGHADALSLSLSCKGNEFLVDPGTFAYHTQKRWRDYFRGTSAHNTVRVDGQDQSVIGGNFMWVHQARAWCESWVPGDGNNSFVGAHDGYKRLSDPVLHRREVSVDRSNRLIRVIDSLVCRGSHQVELFWHFAESCHVSLNDGTVLAKSSGVEITLAFSGLACDIELFQGDEDLPLGWISRRFDEKTPIYSIRRRATISGTTEFITEIYY